MCFESTHVACRYVLHAARSWALHDSDDGMAPRAKQRSAAECGHPIKNSHVSTYVILTWVSTWALAWVSTWALTWELRKNFNHFLTCKSRESSHENHVRYGKMAWKNYIKISFWDYLWIYTFYNLSITYIYRRNFKFRTYKIFADDTNRTWDLWHGSRTL